ncbi:MAG: histidine phosphatase family protein [Steroidobacteraceae bacterium]|nr:histidine phosphatase family protein [Steroidobacteraceae bacterium]MDW8259596.1 histidine phosphatase family protein [Gammaproteobacteria bacterium]
MKRLSLLRHGRAEPAVAGVADFDRALDRRGQSEASAIARRCFDLGLIPQLVLASPALRTRQTADIVIRELELSPRALLLDDNLYLAESAALLAGIAAIGPRIEHLLLVAHNPGITMLARYLLPDTTIAEFATGTLGTMELDIDAWGDLRPGRSRAWQVDAPRLWF